MKTFDPTHPGPLHDVRVLDLSRLVAGNMLTVFLADFGSTGTDLTDHDGNGATTVTDFSVFLTYFGGPVGSSGIACAGTANCTP